MEKLYRLRQLITIILIVLIFSTTNGRGQGIVLRVQGVSDNTTVSVPWSTSWGSYSSDIKRHQQIKVSLRSIWNSNIVCAVKTLFICGNHDPDANELASFEKQFLLHPMQATNFIVTQPALVRHVDHYEALGYQEVSGCAKINWLVVAKDVNTGNPMAVESSDGDLKRLVQKKIDAIRLRPNPPIK